MTNREAIEVIHACMHVNGRPLQAREKAIEALKKQIPKKPIDVDVTGNCIIGKCPVCNRLAWTFRYCKSCGQRLDWSEYDK